jgi:hypothetical protein
MKRNGFLIVGARLWKKKKRFDFTLQDALEAMGEGFYCICKDGGLAFVTDLD